MGITEEELREVADRFWTASAATLTRMARMLSLFSPSDRGKIAREVNDLSLIELAMPSGYTKHVHCAYGLEWKLKNNFIIPEAMFGNTDSEASPVWGQFRISWRYFGGEITFDVRGNDRVPFLKLGLFGWAEKTRSEFIDEMKKHVSVDAIAWFFTDAMSRLPWLEKQTTSLFIRFFSAGSNFDFPFFINRVRELL